MISDYICIVLLIYIGYKEWFFHKEIHALLEKLMVKNLHEFEVSKKVGRIESKPVNKIDPIDGVEPDDYGVLEGII